MIDSPSPLAALRRRIAVMDQTRSTKTSGMLSLGHAGVDAALGGGFAKGRLHEFFATEPGDLGNATGFAFLLGMLAGKGSSPLLWLRTGKAEQVGGKLYGPGLAELGYDPARLLLGVMQDEVRLLRAATDGLRCAGLAAVVIECWGNPRFLDLTASRRLTLAAETTGVTALLLRLDARPTPSAADTRWRIAAAPSIDPLGKTLLGQSTFDLELLRCRAGPDGLRWRLEWNRERQCFEEPGSQAPLSGTLVSLSTAGSAQDHPPRSVGAAA